MEQTGKGFSCGYIPTGFVQRWQTPCVSHTREKAANHMYWKLQTRGFINAPSSDVSQSLWLLFDTREPNIKAQIQGSQLSPPLCNTPEAELFKKCCASERNGYLMEYLILPVSWESDIQGRYWFSFLEILSDGAGLVPGLRALLGLGKFLSISSSIPNFSVSLCCKIG